MYLIDKPFVSDFLIKTIRDNKYKIIATEAAKELISDDSLEWIDEKEAISEMKLNLNSALYSNSENALSWIEQHLGDSDLAKSIKAFKDKVKFRELIQDIFPHFHFKKISLEGIQNISLEDLTFPFVIKPSIGFFSIGVHIVRNVADWENAKMALKPQNLESIYPQNVLDTTNFIIEEFIEGEEYAIDYYHNESGDVVILNVMHHLFSSPTDTSDRVYSTSKEIINRHKNDIEDFLSKIGKRLNLKNFPAHAEIRIDEKGKIMPIEINPLRFGGWCTTGDLLGVTVGFNSYKCFFENRKPDWDIIFSGKENLIYSIVVLDNSTGIKSMDIQDFDYSSLAKDFENPILIRKLDIHKYPVFGFLFAETSNSNQRELDEILISDLKKYVTYAK